MTTRILLFSDRGLYFSFSTTTMFLLLLLLQLLLLFSSTAENNNIIFVSAQASPVLHQSQVLDSSHTDKTFQGSMYPASTSSTFTVKGYVPPFAKIVFKNFEFAQIRFEAMMFPGASVTFRDCKTKATEQFDGGFSFGPPSSASYENVCAQKTFDSSVYSAQVEKAGGFAPISISVLGSSVQFSAAGDFYERTSEMEGGIRVGFVGACGFDGGKIDATTTKSPFNVTLSDNVVEYDVSPSAFAIAVAAKEAVGISIFDSVALESTNKTVEEYTPKLTFAKISGNVVRFSTPSALMNQTTLDGNETVSDATDIPAFYPIRLGTAKDTTFDKNFYFCASPSSLPPSFSASSSSSSGNHQEGSLPVISVSGNEIVTYGKSVTHGVFIGKFGWEQSALQQSSSSSSGGGDRPIVITVSMSKNIFFLTGNDHVTAFNVDLAAFALHPVINIRGGVNIVTITPTLLPPRYAASKSTPLLFDAVFFHNKDRDDWGSYTQLAPVLVVDDLVFNIKSNVQTHYLWSTAIRVAGVRVREPTETQPQQQRVAVAVNFTNLRLSMQHGRHHEYSRGWAGLSAVQFQDKVNLPKSSLIFISNVFFTGECKEEVILVRLVYNVEVGSVTMQHFHFPQVFVAKKFYLFETRLADVWGKALADNITGKVQSEDIVFFGSDNNDDTWGPAYAYRMGSAELSRIFFHATMRLSAGASTGRFYYFQTRYTTMGPVHIHDNVIYGTSFNSTQVVTSVRGSTVLVERVTVNVTGISDCSFLVLNSQDDVQNVIPEITTKSVIIRRCTITVTGPPAIAMVLVNRAAGDGVTQTGGMKVVPTLIELRHNVFSSYAGRAAESAQKIEDESDRVTGLPTLIGGLSKNELRALIGSMSATFTLTSAKLRGIIMENETYINTERLFFGRETDLEYLQLVGPPCPRINGQQLTIQSVKKVWADPSLPAALEQIFDMFQTPLFKVLNINGTCEHSVTATESELPTPTLPPTRTKTTSKTKLPTRSKTHSGTQPFEPAPDVKLSPTLQFVSDSFTGVTVVGALAVGPTVALDAGRALSLLTTVARCRQYREAENKIRHQGPERIAALKELYAWLYMTRDLSFPESFLPGACWGQTDYGRCLRGGVIGGFLIIILAVCGATALGAFLVYREAKGKWKKGNLQAMDENAAAGDFPVPSCDELVTWEAVRGVSRYPYFITQSVAVQLATWIAHAFAFLIAPNIVFSERLFFGMVPVFFCYVFPLVIFCCYLQHVALSRAFEKKEESEHHRFLKCLPQAKMNRDNAFQLEALHVWFPRARAAERSMGDAGPSTKLLGCIFWVEKIFDSSKTKVGRFLFTGDYVWSQGSTRNTVAGGEKGSFLSQCGSLINKYYGPFSESIKKANVMARLRAASHHDDFHFKNDFTRHSANTDELLAKEGTSLRQIISPYTVFINSAWTVAASLAQTVAALHPGRCSDVMAVMCVVSVLALMVSAGLRTCLAPIRNITAVTSDVLVLIACALGYSALTITSEEDSAARSAACSYLLIISIVAVILGAASNGFGKLLQLLKFVKVCTKAEKQLFKLEEAEMAREVEEMTSMERGRFQQPSRHSHNDDGGDYDAEQPGGGGGGWRSSPAQQPLLMLASKNGSSGKNRNSNSNNNNNNDSRRSPTHIQPRHSPTTKTVQEQAQRRSRSDTGLGSKLHYSQQQQQQYLSPGGGNAASSSSGSGGGAESPFLLASSSSSKPTLTRSPLLLSSTTSSPAMAPLSSSSPRSKSNNNNNNNKSSTPTAPRRAGDAGTAVSGHHLHPSPLASPMLPPPPSSQHSFQQRDRSSPPNISNLSFAGGAAAGAAAAMLPLVAPTSRHNNNYSQQQQQQRQNRFSPTMSLSPTNAAGGGAEVAFSFGSNDSAGVSRPRQRSSRSGNTSSSRRNQNNSNAQQQQYSLSERFADV